MRDRATANDVPFAPLDKLFEPTVPKGPELPQVDTLDIAQLHPFADHPFHPRTRNAEHCHVIQIGNALDR